MRKAILIGVAGLCLSIVASAAQRGGAVPMATPPPAMHAMPAPVVTAHVPSVGSHLAPPHAPAHPVAHTNGAPARNVHTANPTIARRVTASPAATTSQPTPIKPSQRFLPSDAFNGQSCYFGSSCYPAPGLGFDFEHFFAVHPNWGRFHPVTGVIIPAWGGGFYYPVPYYTESTPQEGQEENEAVPAEQQESNVSASAPASDETAPTPSRSYGSYAPAQPVEEYVFVKRDGTRIFAVAYSLAKDKLQYVTKEGLRRTLPLDALDYDATMKSNEERGNTVTLPGAPPAAMAMAM